MKLLLVNYKRFFMPIQKKKQSLFSKLGAKLRTPKGRLVATFLIFGAIGGGVLVYKSFAATQSTFYNIQNNNLTASDFGLSRLYSNPCKVFQSVESQKNNSKVWSGTCPSNADPNQNIINFNASNYATTTPTPRINNSYRVCAYMKGASRFFFYVEDSNTTYKKALIPDMPQYINNFSNYEYRCTNAFIVNVPKNLQFGLNAVSTASSGIIVNVSNVILEKL